MGNMTDAEKKLASILPALPPFPGKVERGEYRRIILTDEQVEWLRVAINLRPTSDIVKITGISGGALFYKRALYGIKKTREASNLCKKIGAMRSVITKKENGYYASKRGKPCPCYKAGLRALAEKRAKGLPVGINLYRQEHPEEFKKMIARRTEKWKATFRKEKRRALFGMKLETRLRIVIKPYSKSQLAHRWYANKLGYWFYEDCSESGGERWNIYYDEYTKRSARFEQALMKDGFNVKDGKDK